ncbi:MAG: FAD-binding oxidoreductase [Pseudomonadota bacterium]
MTLNPADDRFADKLLDFVEPAVLRPFEARFREEPRGRFDGQSGILAQPRTTGEVAALIRAAGEARVPVIPYGGGTGLVGGQVMSDGPAPLVVSLERMSAVRGVYPQENVMVAEAGVILADAQAAALEVDRIYPLSLAAEGSARIGGNLATNAGGVNVLRYGNARDLCLGLEAVLPDGSVWNGLSRLRKDNTGYDLRNLLIGSEGTLGIITAAALKLAPRPKASGCAFLTVSSPQAALDLLTLARDHVGDSISAFELIHKAGLEFLQEEMPGIRIPFATLPEWSVLIDLGVSGTQDPQTLLVSLFEEAVQKGISTDGLIAQSEGQRSEFWSVRENIPLANRRIGSVSSHDISVPISKIPEFIRQGEDLIAGIGAFRINCFGHLGDGNLHYNVFPIRGRTREDEAEHREAIKRSVHELVHAFGGSVSAEHGIGRLKVADLERFGDPAKLTAMRQIKTALDPLGIMNPGAVLRA